MRRMPVNNAYGPIGQCVRRLRQRALLMITTRDDDYVLAEATE